MDSWIIAGSALLFKEAAEDASSAIPFKSGGSCRDGGGRY